MAAVGRARQDATRREGELQRKRAALEERASALAAEQQRLESAIAERAERMAGVSGDADAAAEVELADAAQIAKVTQRIAALEGEIAATREHSQACLREQERLRHAAGDASTRLEVLRRMHESGAGLFAGVKAITVAGRVL